MDELEENVYLSEFHAKKGHGEQLASLDNRFHDILYEACNSKMLKHQLKDFHQYVLRIRKKTLNDVDRSIQSNKEHAGIMEAIKKNDPQLAEMLAHEHIINAYENILKNGVVESYDNRQEGNTNGKNNDENPSR